jgi:murein DD-endopeptidase MepM/ murein hydrolase activator NlpD
MGRIAPALVTAAVVLGAGSTVSSQQTGLAAEAGALGSAADPASSQHTSARLGLAAGGARTEIAASRSTPRPMLDTVSTDVAAARHELRTQVRAQTAAEAATVATAERTADAAARLRWLDAFHPPVTKARVTSEFGPRWGRQHEGIDFGADVGVPVHAVARGTVSVAGYNNGLGYHVRLTLDNGHVVSYGHLSRILVEEGDRVHAGDLVGRVGNSGSSTGAHLHLEVWVDDEPVDPRPWLEKRELL